MVDLPERSVPADQPIAAYTLQPPLRDKAEAHARVSHLQYLAGTVWGLVALLLVLRLRLAPRFQALAERVARRRFFQACLFLPLFALTLALFDLPITLWSHIVARSYGLSIQGWGSFARDWLVGQIVVIVIGIVLTWLFYAVMRRAPRRWWLWTWAALLPVLLFVFFLEPFVIEPLFFKFAPLADRDAQLASQLAEISHHEIPVERMFVMEASEKLRSVNAYVTGLGASKRVVVWDTTLQAMTHREIDFVFGHELGHYTEGHVLIGLSLAALGFLFLLWLASRLIDGAIRRWGPAWKIQRVDELASLPLLLFIGSLFSFLTQPIGAVGSRYLEHRADDFGLRAISGIVDDPGQAAAHAFQRLGEIDLADPNPSSLVVFWLYDHPPIRDRVEYVLTSTAGGGRNAGSEATPSPPPR
jgi:Zn-dependent protease with chaperone function